MPDYEQRGGLIVPAGSGRTGTRDLILPDGTVRDLNRPLPPIPAGLAHLDVSAGRAVPWTMHRDGDTIDPARHDLMRTLDCLEDENCGICALPLTYRKGWLLPDSATRIAREAAAHPDCLRYAHAAWGTFPVWLYVTRAYKWSTPPAAHDDHRFVIEVKLPPATNLELLTLPD